MKYEVGKKYRYNKDVFDCIFVTPNGHPVMKSVRDKSEGLFAYPVSFEEYTEPRSGTVFLNIYARENGETWSSAKLTKKEADRVAQGLTRSKRVACIRVNWTEGDGL